MIDLYGYVRPGRVTASKALKLYLCLLCVCVPQSPLLQEGRSVFCSLKILSIPTLKVLL